MSSRRRVDITHADRVMFPIDGITKAEVVEHYRRTAPLMLPHLQDRLLILERFPAGIGGKGFVQQDISRSRPPAWLSRAPAQRSDGWTVEHAVAEHPEDLEWLANQNAITPHRWLSRISHPHRPDLMVIDLDPPDSDFALVRDTARDLRDVLIDTGLVPYAQLTGSRGVHVVVPVTPAADFDIVRDFARQVAQTVVAEDPRHRTLTTRRSARGGRLYLDVMRNGYAQTSVAPYAVRARPHAPVATPIEWDELDSAGLSADRYRLRDISRRIEERGDPWRTMHRHRRSLAAAHERLNRIRAKAAG